MNAKPPTRLTVSGGRNVAPHLVVVDDDRRRQRLAAKATSFVLWFGFWFVLAYAAFTVLGIGD